jgi:hypothetical protein
MFAELRSLPRCAEKLRSLFSFSDAHDMVLCSVSDDSWDGAKVCRPCTKLVARSITDYLIHAWNHRNACKHNGAVLPPPLRWGAGPMAMLLWLNMMMMYRCVCTSTAWCCCHVVQWLRNI